MSSSFTSVPAEASCVRFLDSLRLYSYSSSSSRVIAPISAIPKPKPTSLLCCFLTALVLDTLVRSTTSFFGGAGLVVGGLVPCFGAGIGTIFGCGNGVGLCGGLGCGFCGGLGCGLGCGLACGLAAGSLGCGLLAVGGLVVVGGLVLVGGLAGGGLPVDGLAVGGLVGALVGALASGGETSRLSERRTERETDTLLARCSSSRHSPSSSSPSSSLFGSV